MTSRLPNLHLSMFDSLKKPGERSCLYFTREVNTLQNVSQHTRAPISRPHENQLVFEHRIGQPRKALLIPIDQRPKNVTTAGAAPSADRGRGRRNRRKKMGGSPAVSPSHNRLLDRLLPIKRAQRFGCRVEQQAKNHLSISVAVKQWTARKSDYRSWCTFDK